MELVHIARTEFKNKKDKGYLVTYLFTEEEFKAIQEEAKAKGECDEG